MKILSKLIFNIQDFLLLAKSLMNIYFKNITKKNMVVITVVAILSIVIECVMVVRLFVRHPAMNTPASRVYFGFYLSLIFFSFLVIVLQHFLSGNVKRIYWLHACFVGIYLLWNVLLNSYDLHRNSSGSSLAIVMAIVFASILIQLVPQHMILLQLSTFILFFILNYSRIEDKINATIAIVVSMTASILFFYQEVQRVHQQQRIAQMNIHIEKEQLDAARQYIQHLQTTQEQTRIYHHDLRHTFNLLEQMALVGDVTKLQEFISVNQKRLENFTPAFYCDHEIINLILGSFDQRAQEKNITLKTEIRLPETLLVSDSELCSLLFNLLENALHAVEEVTDLDCRSIYIKAIMNQTNLVILVENSFVGEILMKDGYPVSKVQDKNHGFGILSILNIVEHYQGFCVFEAKNQIFRAKVLLHL